jgi:hypothetical protein
MDLNERACEEVNWLYLAKGMVQWWIINIVMNLLVLQCI